MVLPSANLGEFFFTGTRLQKSKERKRLSVWAWRPDRLRALESAGHVSRRFTYFKALRNEAFLDPYVEMRRCRDVTVFSTLVLRHASETAWSLQGYLPEEESRDIWCMLNLCGGPGDRSPGNSCLAGVAKIYMDNEESVQYAC